METDNTVIKNIVEPAKYFYNSPPESLVGPQHF